jgi:uncharacterized protein YbaR (Trm112 family)
MPVPEELIEIMACPECRGPLEDRGEALACTRCGLHYPVSDGIPVMLVEEAYRPGDGDRP